MNLEEDQWALFITHSFYKSREDFFYLIGIFKPNQSQIPFSPLILDLFFRILQLGSWRIRIASVNFCSKRFCFFFKVDICLDYVRARFLELDLWWRRSVLCSLRCELFRGLAMAARGRRSSSGTSSFCDPTTAFNLVKLDDGAGYFASDFMSPTSNSNLTRCRDACSNDCTCVASSSIR